MNTSAIRCDKLGSDQVVARQAVLRGQVAYPATERESADTGGADNASRRHQTENLRLFVEVEPGRAALGAGYPGRAVHLDASHPREVDDQATVEDAVPCRIVTRSAHSDLQFVDTREIEGDRDVRRPDASRYDRRPAVDQSVEADAGSLVLAIRRPDDRASQRAPQLIQAIDNAGSYSVPVCHVELSSRCPPMS